MNNAQESGSSTLKTLFPNFMNLFAHAAFSFNHCCLDFFSFSFNGRPANTDHAWAIAISRTGPTVNVVPARSSAIERPLKDRGGSIIRGSRDA